MDKHRLTADVYKHIEMEMYNPELDTLWDFGTFTCVGTDQTPVSVIQPYHEVVQEKDTDWVSQFSSESIEKLLYTYDYAVYVPTDESFEELNRISSNIRYFIDGHPYQEERTFTIEGNEYTRFGARHDERLVQRAEFERKIEDGDWEMTLLLKN